LQVFSDVVAKLWDRDVDLLCFVWDTMYEYRKPGR
jgi:hypothetical protein